MPRQRKDGKSLPKKRTVKLTDAFVHSVKPEAERVTYYDPRVVGFALRVEPSGARAYKFTYRHRKKPRWYSLGKVSDYCRRSNVRLWLEADLLSRSDLRPLYR